MSAHTPGPWCLYDADDPSHQGAARHIHAEAQAVKHRASAIVKVFGRLDAPDERDANARLIAAAPDLLEALKAIVALDDGDEPGLWHFTAEFDAARAAIQKAEGA